MVLSKKREKEEGESGVSSGSPLNFSQDDFFETRSHPQFSIEDLRNIGLLSLWGVVLYFLGLNSLEFFRHTEADRTLIAWEMLTRHDYVVPHILSSPILTKPPLYYWIVAGAMRFFGGADEWIVRTPSAITALLFILTQYVIFCLIGSSRKLSFVSALMLGSGVLFFGLGVVAEIDMVFGFLCALALYGIYFSVLSPKVWKTVLSYCVLGLSFLAKGPPGVAFFLVSYGLFFLWYRTWKDRKMRREYALSTFFLTNVVGALFFLFVVFPWGYLVVEKVGFEEIKYQFQTEILERAFSPSKYQRGELFYLGSLFVGLLPWSVFGVLGFLSLLLKKSAVTFREIKENSPVWEFFIFNAIVVSTGFLMLSISEGKSTRYLFPLYPFAINLTLSGLLLLKDTMIEKTLFRIGAKIGFLLGGALFLSSFFITIEGVSQRALITSASMLFVSLIFLGISCKKQSRKLLIFSFCLITLAARVSEVQIYSVHRNEKRSVKAIAASISAVVPQGAPIYTVELFERWVIYYLKRDGRVCERLTPLTSKNPQATPDGRVYILLSVDDELWRGEQLSYYDKSLKLLREYHSGKEEFLLLEASAEKVRYLSPRKRIPTVPSPEHYSEGADWTP